MSTLEHVNFLSVDLDAFQYIQIRLWPRFKMRQIGIKPYGDLHTAPHPSWIIVCINSAPDFTPSNFIIGTRKLLCFINYVFIFVELARTVFHVRKFLANLRLLNVIFCCYANWHYLIPYALYYCSISMVYSIVTQWL